MGHTTHNGKHTHGNKRRRKASAFSLEAKIKRIKAVAVELLKAEKLRIDHWHDKEATRDGVRLAIRDFLWSESTGLPVDQYTEDDVQARAEEVYRHVYRVYPTLPSPYYATAEVA